MLIRQKEALIVLVVVAAAAAAVVVVNDFSHYSDLMNAVCYVSCVKICTIVFRTTLLETSSTTSRLDDHI